jgi:hypothetical protein
MRKKIKNTLKITCTDIDLTTVSNIEFYIRQLKFFGCYVPKVISSSEMIVVIPFEEAKKMHDGKAEVQLAFTDENGNPRATEPVTTTVGNLLKEVGYNAV